MQDKSKHMFQSRQSKTYSEGYIVVVVLLLTAVLLMLGLSMAAQTTEQVFLSSQEADSTRVFNAAESGIEDALYQLETGTVSIDQPTTTFEFDNLNESAVDVIGTKPTEINNINIAQGESMTVPFPSGPTSFPIFTWNQSDSCGAEDPAFLVTLYTDEAGGRAYHQTYSSTSNGSTKCYDKLNKVATFIDGTPKKNSITLTRADFGSPPEDSALFYRITPLYGDATFLSVTHSGAVQITSTATDIIEGGGATTNEQRRIQVIRTEPAPPSIFDYALFSGGNLEKE